MSRRHGLDKVTSERIYELLRLGNYIETTAYLVGVSRPAFFRWMKQGSTERRQREIYGKVDKSLDWAVDFVQKVREAQAQAEARDLETIRLASESQWQAAAWRLERKFPKRWGRQTTHQIAPAKHGRVEVNITAESLSDDELAAIARGVQ